MISATRYAKASRKNKNVINKIQYSQFVTITFNYFSIKPLLNQKKINSKAKLLIKKEKNMFLPLICIITVEQNP